MIQKDYLVATPLMAAGAIADIEKTLRTTPHKDALLTIYETGFPKGMVKKSLHIRYMQVKKMFITNHILPRRS